MQSPIRRLAIAAGIAMFMVMSLGGCKREAPLPPPPTPERLKTGIDESMERVRNNPNLTPKQKEEAYKLLQAMKASAEQQQRQQQQGR